MAALTEVIRKIPPYNAIIEGSAHRKEDAVTATDVAAHWHEHFSSDVGESNEVLNAQVICFFNIASGAEFGTLIMGRRGAPTRFSFSVEALNKFIHDGVTESDHTVSEKATINEQKDSLKNAVSIAETKIPPTPPVQETLLPELGQAIFVAHGKNKRPLEQLKRILDQFKIPYKVTIDEPNLGRPISGKVREIMKSCNCAILIFTADEEFYNKDNKSVWRPSENVVHELGASGYLYDNRIVIMKEERVDFPSNFSDIGYISFETDQLEAKALDILKELIGFGIVKVST